jgi:hypothetical protein
MIMLATILIKRKVSDRTISKLILSFTNTCIHNNDKCALKLGYVTNCVPEIAVFFVVVGLDGSCWRFEPQVGPVSIRAVLGPSG